MGEDLRKEFADAFERHSDELFRHASLRLPSRERALELSQECFLKAWDYVRRGEEVRQYRSFLYRILNNLIIDEYRRARVQSLDAMMENTETRDAIEGDLLRDETDDLEAAMVRYDAGLALEALSSLHPSYRDTLVMRYVDGLSVTEISEMTGESANAISVRIHRGLRKLRELLEHHE